MIANGHDTLAGPFTRREQYRLISRKACERINFVAEKNNETQAAIERDIARRALPHPLEKHTVGSGYLQNQLTWLQTESRALLALMAYHATERLRAPVSFPALVVVLLLLPLLVSGQSILPPGYQPPVTSPKGSETFASTPMVLTVTTNRPPDCWIRLVNLTPREQIVEVYSTNRPARWVIEMSEGNLNSWRKMADWNTRSNFPAGLIPKYRDNAKLVDYFILPTAPTRYFRLTILP